MTQMLDNVLQMSAQCTLSEQQTLALIPAYNEERFIGSIVLSVAEYVNHVIVIDDGSKDRTVEIARRAGATVIEHKINQGKAKAVNTGFTYARQINAAAVVMLDGDGQHSATDVPTVLAPIYNQSADIVVGSRFMSIKSDIPTYRQVGQHGLTLVTNLASGVRISDSQSGFRAFSSKALENLSFSQEGFSIESEMQFQIREHNLKVVEVPINVSYAEQAKRNPFNHGMQVLNGIMRLVGQVRPLLFFGLSGLCTFLLGAAVGIYVINIYAQTKELAIGYGLITVILCVVGMLLFFAGVVLHSVRSMFLDLRRSLFSRLFNNDI
jgi:glycosyltransferase involved in cell wall biosynthesis